MPGRNEQQSEKWVFHGVPAGDRRLCVFGDEAGDMTFARGPGITRYFYLTTVVFLDHKSLLGELQELRHDLAAQGHDRRHGFHATSDPQWIRDLVFDVLCKHDFAVDVTIFDKAKAAPSIRSTELDFYRFAWFWHMRRVLPDRCLPAPGLLLVAAELSVRAKRSAYHGPVQAAMSAVAPRTAYETAFWPSSTDLCLQAADYCSWAVLRKWERADVRSYDLIADRIGREYDLFQRGGITHY
jgi:hypothetical protein